MPTKYPEAFDNFTNPTGVTDLDTSAFWSHGQQHSDLNDAVEALQLRLGINGVVGESEKVRHIAEHAAMGVIGDNYYTSPIVDLTTSGWSKVDGGGADASVTPSPVSGFSVRLKSNYGVTGYVASRRAIVPITIGSTDTITLELNIPDASLTRNITFRLLVDTSGKKFDVAGYETWHAGRNTVSFKLSDMTATGGALSTDTFSYIQVDMVGPTTFATSLEIDIGRVWVGGASKLPLCCITFDAAYAKVYDWAYVKYMKPLGLVGNLYIMSSVVGNSGHMTLENCREVVADGWGVGLYGHVPLLGANTHNITGVTTAQSILAGGSFIIDGMYASGGIATFDVPRYVTVVLGSGNDSTNGFLITGTNASGGVYSEYVRGCSSSATKVVTKNKFSSVSSVVALANTAGTVSIGTAFTGSEVAASAAIGQAWLAANGFQPAVDWAYPLGETNNDSESALRGAGFLTARTVVNGGPPFLEPCPGTERNLMFMPGCVILGDAASAATLKTRIDNEWSRGYDFFILGHLSNTGPTDETELKTSLAYIAQLHRAGSIRVVSFDDFRRIRRVGV